MHFMGNENPKMLNQNLYQKRTLVGSPVYQKPKILEAFLKSLHSLNHNGSTPDYIFVDDNADEESRRLLAGFQREGSATIILPGMENTGYVCDEESHHWNDNLMLKVANFKNQIIQYAIDNAYDSLFFVDSDLVLHPDLLIHLEQQNQEVVSEIFWTRWHDGLPMEPNVWLFDEYDLVPKQLGEEWNQMLGEEENARRRAGFIEQLKRPGLYEVGGLGACTLISRSALLKSVNFSPIRNLTIHGEDRFFCIRAAVLNIGLFVDTCFPAYHIYREPDLAGAADYMARCGTNIGAACGEACGTGSGETPAKNKITLSMVVRNEEGRYLECMLKSLAGHIDNAVIIDDASTDGTVSMCRALLPDIPLKIIQNKESMFADEISLRKKQWEETVKTDPQWILNLDADEILEESFWDDAQAVIDDPGCVSCAFRLYDMWTKDQYREDAFWNSHNIGRIFLIRYQPGFQYRWHETPQHCGRFPVNCSDPAKGGPEYRIQHLGWSSAKDRELKYKRYRNLDPGSVYGIEEQYESILDQDPRLLSWQKL